MPEENWWPRDDMWNKHYFGQNAFNAAPERYDASIAKGFGKPKGTLKIIAVKRSLSISSRTKRCMKAGWIVCGKMHRAS